MKDIIQTSRNMNIVRYIAMVEFKVFPMHKMFNIFQITCDQVIHCNDVIILIDEIITQMRPQKSSAPGDEVGAIAAETMAVLGAGPDLDVGYVKLEDVLPDVLALRQRHVDREHVLVQRGPHRGNARLMRRGIRRILAPKSVQYIRACVKA